MTGLEMGLLGISGANALFGSGGKVSVPGAMAQPTDPTTKFVDESGMLRPEFQTAGLSNQYMDEATGLLGQLKNRATAQGPSASAQYLINQGELGAQSARDQMGRDQSSAQASQEANLAMKGGLGSGARERMAADATRQKMFGGQQIARDQNVGKMGVLAQDEQQKLGILKSLPGQYGNFGADQMNRQVNDVQGGMNLLQDKYNADMQAWAGNQMTRAQAQQFNQGNKGILGGLF